MGDHLCAEHGVPVRAHRHPAQQPADGRAGTAFGRLRQGAHLGRHRLFEHLCRFLPGIDGRTGRLSAAQYAQHRAVRAGAFGHPAHLPLFRRHRQLHLRVPDRQQALQLRQDALHGHLHRQPVQVGAVADRICTRHLRVRRVLRLPLLRGVPHPHQHHLGRAHRIGGGADGVRHLAAGGAGAQADHLQRRGARHRRRQDAPARCAQKGVLLQGAAVRQPVLHLSGDGAAHHVRQRAVRGGDLRRGASDHHPHVVPDDDLHPVCQLLRRYA